MEPGGPREHIFFDPPLTRAAIVTCGGLCPGLNNVIRGLVLELADSYGVTEVLGFRDGFRGLVDGSEPVRLSHGVVADIHNRGGTILGTSRGGQDPGAMVATLERLGVNLLFVIGGDGTLRGAQRIADEADRRGLTRCRWSASRRRSTTTSRTSTRASASRPRSAGPPSRSSPR